MVCSEMVLCSIDSIQLTRNGSPISGSDGVQVGDTLGVTVNTDPSGNQTLINIGKDPKSGCVLCNLDCAPDSDHIVQRNGFDGQKETFNVTDAWLQEAQDKNSASPFLLVEASCKGTLDSSEFCSENNVSLDIKPAPSADVSITNLQVPSSASVNEAIPINFSLVNDGNASTSGVVSLVVDGQTVNSSSVTISAGQTIQQSFNWVPIETGAKQVCVSFNGAQSCSTVSVTGAQQCTVNIPVVGDTNCVVAAVGFAGVGLLGITTFTLPG